MSAVTEPRRGGGGGAGGPGGSAGDGTGRHRRVPPPVRRVAIVVVLLVVGAASVDVLGDLTQTRPDHVDPRSRSDIVLSVETRNYHQPSDDAARNLWAACAGTTGRRLAETGFVPLDDGAVRFSVEPGLGKHAERRLVGCLEDATLDRVQGTVRSVELIEP